MVKKPFFSPITLGGEIIGFDHLDPFQISVPSELVRRQLTVDIKFTNHCFSYGDEDTSVEEGELYDHNNKRRLFCPKRYQLSLELPNILRNMNHPRVKVWQTSARRNWTHVIQIDEPALPYEGPYYIFFELRKARRDERDDLKLIVESAYHAGEGYASPRLVGRIGFHLLCGKTYLRQRLSTKR